MNALGIFEPHASWLANFAAALLGVAVVAVFIVACAAVLIVAAYPARRVILRAGAWLADPLGYERKAGER